MEVILADDTALTRRLLQATLEQRGHTVIAVADGAQAWKAFELSPAPLVVLDWQMPELDGVEVCRRIRASDASRDTFVLMVTARDSTDDLARALDAGADDYAMKPITPVHFAARIAIAERRIGQNAARWRAEESLARAQWLSGIGETALAIQHEVNNPLAALLTSASVILMDDTLPPALRLDLESINQQARRIADVVRRLKGLEEPSSVEYIAGSRMIDLSGQQTEPKHA